MSHCSGENVSASVAGAFGRSPGDAPLASVESSLLLSSLVAKPPVPETLSIRLSLSMLARKDALSDFAIATPICGYACTSDPPAFCTFVATSDATAFCL